MPEVQDGRLVGNGVASELQTCERTHRADVVKNFRRAVGAPTSNADEVRSDIPKNVTVTADTSGRGLVLMIVNHRLENQNGFAFFPDGAKQVTGRPIKNADAALALNQGAA